jgi:carboxypeptidase Q
MRPRALLASTLLLCQAADDVQQRLTRRAFSNTPILSDLHELCDGIGGRPTGSPACNRAIE